MYITENETMELRVTDHAYDRMKERCGWNKKAAHKMATRAFERGIRADDVKGSVYDKIVLTVMHVPCGNYCLQQSS